MTRTAAIIAGAALLAVGCNSPQRPSTWRKIVNAPRPALEEDDRPRAYAAELHKILLDARVPHKIVTAEFAYQSSYQSFATGRRTVVVYRDVTKKGVGWWLMDERLNSPMWLPDSPLERQIAFYLRRPVTLIDVSDFPGGDAGKMVIPLEKTPAPRSGITRIERVQEKPTKPAERAKGVAPKPAKPLKPAASSKIEPPAKPAPTVPRTVEKPAAKPVEKKPAEPKPVAKPVAPKPKAPEKKGPPGGKRETPAAKPEGKKPAVVTPPAKKPAASDTQPAAASPGRPPEARKPKSQNPGKPAPKPAVKAEPSDKPATKPNLIDKADSTPQATIVPDAPKKEEPKPEADPKPNATEPPKTSFINRLFRRVFRA